MRADMMLCPLLPIARVAHAEEGGDNDIRRSCPKRDLRNNSTCGQINIKGRYQDPTNAGENGAGGKGPYLAERTSVQTEKRSGHI